VPTYSISGPDGKTYSIDGPEGATRDQVIAKIKEQQATKTQDEQRTLPQALGEAVGNLPGSAIQAATDLGSAVAHPIETVKGLGRIGLGVGEQVGLLSGDKHKKAAEAFEQHYKDAYGSWEGFKKALAEDPVGVIADASLAFGGVGELAELGGASRAAKVAKTAAKYTNPASVVGPVVRGAGKVAAQTAGLLGGTGEALEEAGRAGYEAGLIRPAAEKYLGVKPTGTSDAMRAFERHMSGAAPTGEPVRQAKGAVRNIKTRASDKFERDLAPVLTDPTILSWNDVDTAIADTDKVQSFEGYDWGRATKAVRDAIKQEVYRWQNSRASTHSTIRGFHALKQNIGQIVDDTEAGTPARMVATRIYDAVRDTAAKQNPAYGKIMGEYADAVEQVQELEKELSLGKTATISTGLRKLLSSLRNNVHANFARREDLVKFLQDAGAPHLLSMIAGQSLRGWQPRGVGRLAAGAETLVNPAMGAATIAALSPRAAGHVAKRVGQAAKTAGNLYPPFRSPQAGYQAGRFTRNQDSEGDPYYEPLENAPVTR
jgi:hypothetical protein